MIGVGLQKFGDQCRLAGVRFLDRRPTRLVVTADQVLRVASLLQHLEGLRHRLLERDVKPFAEGTVTTEPRADRLQRRLRDVADARQDDPIPIAEGRIDGLARCSCRLGNIRHGRFLRAVADKDADRCLDDPCSGLGEGM